LKCIQAVIDGEPPATPAVERQMSARQIRPLAKRYRGEAPVGLISRRCRRPSNNRLDSVLEHQVAGSLLAPRSFRLSMITMPVDQVPFADGGTL
jgi:hypothetical protein